MMKSESNPRAAHELILNSLRLRKNYRRTIARSCSKSDGHGVWAFTSCCLNV